jgi:hypothetical protein
MEPEPFVLHALAGGPPARRRMRTTPASSRRTRGNRELGAVPKAPVHRPGHSSPMSCRRGSLGPPRPVHRGRFADSNHAPPRQAEIGPSHNVPSSCASLPGRRMARADQRPPKGPGGRMREMHNGCLPPSADHVVPGRINWYVRVPGNPLRQPRPGASPYDSIP